MGNNTKTAKHFSVPLMKQNIKSNLVLAVVITLIFCMITTVITAAMNMMGTTTSPAVDIEDAQEQFYSHLFAMAAYKQMTGTELSVDDFLETDDRSTYDTVFEMIGSQSEDLKLSSDVFADSIAVLTEADGSVDSYVEQFEYIYALSDEKGVFSDEELSIDEMMSTMISGMGMDSDQFNKMAKMDRTSMLNKMYFTVMGLIPLLIFVVIVGNSLIASQVDCGSMAYVLATPTKRSAVANTQAIFLILAPLIICMLGCGVRIAASTVLTGESNIAMNAALYGGMYVLIEAIGGLCYMGSCLFNQSKKATAFGGGIAVWCFIASLLGIFGSEDMVNMGVGIEELGIFNKLTLVGLYDIKALATVGSGDVNYDFVWKLCVLAGIAIVSYAIGKFRFQKKDLPL